MSQIGEKNLALFIDFDNVALGARDARQQFDIQLLLQRVLEKGKIIIKRAYADWYHHKQYMSQLHEAAIDLIEVPSPRISGKNSADIRLVVDAIDLCYAKDHIDTFVIVSGDSDFSPLVSKLRENNKQVIGIGMRNSSSHLLISNCDEFIFYDDIYRSAAGRLGKSTANVPSDKRKLFEFLLTTTQRLLQESRGMLYSSLIKDTMKRKQPDFNETNYGYSTFGDLLEDVKKHGLLVVERDARAGGTWVVQGLGPSAATEGERPASKSRRSRRRRSDNGRGDRRGRPAQEPGKSGGAEASAAESGTSEAGAAGAGATETGTTETGATEKGASTAGPPRADRRDSSTTPAPIRSDTSPPPPDTSAKAPAKKTARKTTKKTTKAVKKPAKKAAKKTASKKTTKAGPGTSENFRKSTKKPARKKTQKKASGPVKAQTGDSHD